MFSSPGNMLEVLDKVEENIQEISRQIVTKRKVKYHYKEEVEDVARDMRCNLIRHLVELSQKYE